MISVSLLVITSHVLHLDGVSFALQPVGDEVIVVVHPRHVIPDLLHLPLYCPGGCGQLLASLLLESHHLYGNQTLQLGRHTCTKIIFNTYGRSLALIKFLPDLKIPPFIRTVISMVCRH